MSDPVLLERGEQPEPSAMPEEIAKAVRGVTGEFMEGLREHSEEIMKSEQKPKGFFSDPFSLLDSIGMGYRANPSQITFDTLRQMTERNTLLGAIILTRINQVASFCRPQENKYSVGFKIRPRGREKNRRLNKYERERVDYLERFILNMGRDVNVERDGLEQFMRKSVRDRLTYDQVGWEKTKTLGNRLHSVFCLPGETLRIAHPTSQKAAPPSRRQLGSDIRYVQLVTGQIVAEFTGQELGYMVANPRTSMKTYGYGFPEPEMLISTVTAHIWAEEWNRRAFSQGSTIKGVLNIKGSIPPQQFEAFKRQWYAQVSGVQNAWKTPVTNSDGMDWTPLQMTNTEMGYQMWMEYLVKIACAIYQMDPAEINFDLRGGSGQQSLFISTNEAQQEQSKDRGLRPLLRFLQDNVTRHIIQQIDEEYEFAFVGLDAKTEEQAIELRMKEAQTYLTINEVRAKEGLPPVEDGDIIANPTFTGYLTQKAMQDQQAQMMGGGGGGEEAAGPPPTGAPGPGQEDEGQPQQEQPYAGKFAQAQGDEEEHAAKQLHHADKNDDDEPTPGHVNHRALHVNDWMSTVHSSLESPDLKKSDGEVEVYDTIDL